MDKAYIPGADYRSVAFTKRLCYCPVCDKASIKSMFEKRACCYCRSERLDVDVPYSVYTIVAWIVIIACATPFLVYRDVADVEKYSVLILALVVSFALAAIGVGRMKAKGQEIGRKVRDGKKRARKIKTHE
jgi:hypothetical protein